MRAIRVKVAGPAFLGLVGHGNMGMGAQIVPEGEMADSVQRMGLEKMQLRGPNARLAGQGAIAPPLYAQFPMPCKSKRLDPGAQQIKCVKSCHQGHQVDDRLGGEARHGR